MQVLFKQTSIVQYNTDSFFKHNFYIHLMPVND